MPSVDVYSSAHFSLELDGTQVGTLRSIDGGTVKLDVVTYQYGDHGDTWRQLGKAKYDDVKFVISLAGAAGLWSWMDGFIKGTGTTARRSGALIAADYNYKAKARRTFADAIISALDFPKFDATDKNSANVTVTISPEKVTFEKGNDAVITENDLTNTAQQQVAACNFEFTYDGVGPEITSRVSKVDAFSLKTKVIEYHYGGRIEPAKQAGKLEFPNLVFYLPEVDAEPFRKLHMESAKGNRAPMKSAHLKFHDNSQAQRGEFTFTNCHIFNVAPEKQDSSTEDIRLVKVEMAMEGLTFSLS